MTKVSVLILSSNESLKIAHDVAAELESYGGLVPTLWNQDEAQEWILADILDKIIRYPYIVVVLGRDELVRHREREFYAARDNVILELGASLAAHEHATTIPGERETFVLYPADLEPPFKVPSDLNGRAYHGYHCSGDNCGRQAVASACNKIHHAMARHDAEGSRKMGILAFHKAVYDLHTQLKRKHRHGFDVIVAVNQGGAIVSGLLFGLHERRTILNLWIDSDAAALPRSARIASFQAELEYILSKHNGNEPFDVLLVDDTLRSGKAMIAARACVQEVADRGGRDISIQIGVIVYRPEGNKRRYYEPSEIEKILIWPHPERFFVDQYHDLRYAP